MKTRMWPTPRGDSQYYVRRLKLSDWLDRLDAENQAVNSVLSDRDDESNAKAQLSMKTVRFNTDKAYTNIVKAINGLILAEGETLYASFVIKVNRLTDRFHHSMAQSKGQKSKKTNGDDEEDGDEEGGSEEGGGEETGSGEGEK